MAKIALFVSSMHGGGAERVAALLSNEWVAAGHEVVLVPTFSGKGECNYPLDERVQLKFLVDEIGRSGRSATTQIRRLLGIRRIIRHNDIDAVVSFLTRVNLAVIVATRGLALPVVIGECTYPPKTGQTFTVKTLTKLLYPLATKVVMQTAQGLAWLSSYCPRSQGLYIANPVTYPIPPRPGRIEPGHIVQEGERILLAVGRFHRAKGFDLLLAAFAQLVTEFPQWRLVILGDGELRNELEVQRAQLGIADKALLPGAAGNVSEWYESADLAVLSSRYEGFPNALLETMAHGNAVVSFDCDTGPSEMIESGTNGVLVPESTGIDGLAESLAALMRDDNERARLGAAAARVRETYNVRSIARQWTDLCQSSV